MQTIACALAAAAVSACSRPAENRLQGYVEGEFVYVASPLGGALESLFVQRGAQVKAGDPLFVLDSAAERAARDQAQAALVLSEKDLARMEKLAHANLIAMQELDRARSTRDQDRERLKKAEWDLSQKRQNAPQAGLVFDTLFRPGEWVPSGRPVVALLPPGNIKVRAFVPETEIGTVRVGYGARVHVDGVDQPLAGRVGFISPKAEYTPPVIYSRETREKLVFMIEILFDPAAGAKLHPGQPVDVELLRS
ncbi:MAG TPA: HlyD family efflux transporter periplasmic adaptor subunit [Verrucomicrobiae bacterium]|jgi:HlyD family secretion protein|nr:HlyD family efflux transporter periplasmic adaptor subunit [Verrucomicrobiae bacterium]